MHEIFLTTNKSEGNIFGIVIKINRDGLVAVYLVYTNIPFSPTLSWAFVTDNCILDCNTNGLKVAEPQGGMRCKLFLLKPNPWYTLV